MLANREFYLPPVLLTGSGSSEKVGEQCQRLGVKKGLIVTDKVMSKMGLPDTFKQHLQKQNLSAAVYDGVDTEPTVDFINEGTKIFKREGCDFLLAVGGGSAIDTAKGIAVMTANPGSIVDYKGAGKVAKAGAPLLAIPTTAGTGSEVTQFTVITDRATNVKMLITSPLLIPNVAIVDPTLTLSCPKNLTATVAIDALTHAIEAYVSKKAQVLSDIFCLSAVRTISASLRAAWQNGQDLEAREKVMMGALEAGIAFSNASVALVHGMSRPIGAYFHVAHGASNAALLGVLTRFSLSGSPARYAQIAAAMGEEVAGLSDMEAAGKGAAAITRLLKDIKIQTLRELGVEKSKLEQLASTMAGDAIASGSPSNNPRQASQAEMVDLYKEAYDTL
jgi:alcohol dehydrogenase class IV